MSFDENLEISPTLAEFLNVHPSTKMKKDDAINGIIDYIKKKKLLIDGRRISVDEKLKHLFFPESNEKTTGNNNLYAEVLISDVVLMHFSPEFIKKDKRRFN